MLCRYPYTHFRSHCKSFLPPFSPRCVPVIRLGTRFPHPAVYAQWPRPFPGCLGFWVWWLPPGRGGVVLCCPPLPLVCWAGPLLCAGACAWWGCWLCGWLRCVGCGAVCAVVAGGAGGCPPWLFSLWCWWCVVSVLAGFGVLSVVFVVLFCRCFCVLFSCVVNVIFDGVFAVRVWGFVLKSFNGFALFALGAVFGGVFVWVALSSLFWCGVSWG